MTSKENRPDYLAFFAANESEEEDNTAQGCVPNVSETFSGNVLTYSEVVSRSTFGAHRQALLGPHSSSINTVDTRSVEDDDTVESKVRTASGKKARKVQASTAKATSSKKLMALDSFAIACALRPCCPKNCHEQFNFAQVKKEREEFWSLNTPKQQDWVTRQLAIWGALDVSKHSFKFSYHIQDIPCCATFFENALPCSHGRLSSIRQRVLSNSLEDQKRIPSPVNQGKQDRAEQFLHGYMEKHGNGMPNERTVQLPMGSTKENVYMDYLCSFPTEEDAEREACSLSHWYRTWKNRVPDLKCGKWHKFTKCSVCSNIKTMKGFTKGDELSGTSRHLSSNSCGHDFPKFTLNLASSRLMTA